MADFSQGSDGVQRRADVALRTAGGQAVSIRLPQAAANGDDAEQLGLAVPIFADVELAPAAFRKLGKETTLMVSSSAVESVTGTLAYDSADVLFATAAGIVIKGVLYDLVAWTMAQAAGVPCAYYLTLEKPAV